MYFLYFLPITSLIKIFAAYQIFVARNTFFILSMISFLQFSVHISLLHRMVTPKPTQLFRLTEPLSSLM